MSDRYSKIGTLKYFKYDHLPETLQGISKPFSDLAYVLADRFLDESADTAETFAGLRKLLEAKDCAVRAALS